MSCSLTELAAKLAFLFFKSVKTCSGDKTFDKTNRFIFLLVAEFGHNTDKHIVLVNSFVYVGL